MQNQNIYTLFASRFDTASAFIRNERGDDVLSYGDLERASAQLARHLSTLGLNKGDRVLVQVEKSPAVLLLYFACLRAGLIYLPLNTAYREQELGYFIENAEPALIVCDPFRVEFFNRLAACPVRTLDATGQGSAVTALAADEAADDPTVLCDADDIAVILYTSGTTGKPKGAMITHGNLAANAMALHKAWEWQAGDVMLHALPIFHIHGLFVGVHLAVLNSSPIIYLPKFEPQAVIDQLPHATVFMGVPTYYVRLLGEPQLDANVCRNMHLFTSGSAPLSPQTFHAFRERTGHTIVERYGMTETGMNTSNPIRGERKPGTVGPPLGGVQLRVVDNENRACAINETGQLQVKGPNVFRGYWRWPEKTAAEFGADGFFKTGDLASIDADGYVAIVGRDKDMIISGGLNVYPKEIENAIDDIEGVVESAVIGVAHADFGEAVTAAVVRAPGANLAAQDIIDALKTRLANFKVPKTVHFIDALPRNAMGKVVKSELRERYGASSHQP